LMYAITSNLVFNPFTFADQATHSPPFLPLK
jgi:hypothetical protein